MRLLNVHFALIASNGFAEIRNYVSVPRLEAKIIFDGKVNSRLFPILTGIIVSGAFRALRVVKLITKSSLSVSSKYDSYQSLHNLAGVCVSSSG